MAGEKDRLNWESDVSHNVVDNTVRQLRDRHIEISDLSEKWDGKLETRMRRPCRQDSDWERRR